MIEQIRFSASRGQMISARIIAPSLRTNEYQMEGDHLHLLVLISGTMEIFGAGQSLNIVSAGIVYLPKGKQRTIRLQAGTRLAWVKVSEIGLAHAIPQSLDNSTLRQFLARTIQKTLSAEERNVFVQDIEMIATEAQDRQAGADVITTSLLSILLVRLWRKAVSDTAATSSAHGNLLDGFVQLCQSHRHEHWSIEQYCQKLATSRERLQVAVHRATNLTPQAYIHQAILNDARDLLQNTSLQINEIAFRLGFQDPAYFNRFFTRTAGLPPGRYRKDMRRSDDKNVPSFASWP